MFLKKLEIFGFKSFAEKTVLEFEPGITAIVGPNGTGKSNIVDAIKWVLGEQSAKELRGSNMEDVIFNGTESQERVNFAEVSLEISNEDGKLPIEFSEVTISRRLFRTGESEYLINKIPVRLRDIQELIAGTGIGTKAYSLMEQGKIDLILSSKPEERRFVFEEASGITKFKNKKKEALRKLEHTEDNLLRVSDIISEVRRQISSLERQARRAEKYKLLYEELKEKELQLAGFQIKKARDFISSYIEQKEEKEKEYASLDEVLKVKEKEAKNLRDSIAQLSEEIAHDESKLREMQSQLLRNEEKIKWNKETIVENEGKMHILTEELEEIKKRKEALQEKIEEKDSQKIHFQEEEGDLKSQIEQKQKELLELTSRQDAFKEQIENLKSEILKINFELTHKRNLLLELETEIKSLKSQLRRLSEEKNALSSGLESEEAEIARLRPEIQESEAQLKQIEEKEDNLLQRKGKILEERNLLEKEREHVDKELVAARAKLSSWKETYTRTLSYLKKVKSVSAQIGEGFLGMLSEILKVSDENLNLVETAYEYYLDAVVVKRKEDAFRLLDIYRKEKLSGIRIIILGELKTPEYPRIEDAVPIAEFIKIVPELRNLLSLIQNSFYTSEFEKARELNAKFPMLRFITPPNMVLEQNMVSLGSSFSEGLGYIDRGGKIRRLEESIKDLETRLEELNRRIAESDNEISHLEKAIEQLNKENQDLNYQLVVLNKTLETHEKSRRKLSEEEEVVNMDIEEVKSQLHSDTSREHKLHSEIEEKESYLQTLESRLVSSQNELNTLIDKRHNYSIEIAHLETKAASFNERKEQFYSLYNSLKSELGNLNKDEIKRRQEYEDTFGRIAQLKDENESLEDANIKLAQEVEGLDTALKDKRKNYEGKKSEFEKVEDVLMNMRNQYTGGKDELYDIELKINEADYKIKSIRNRLTERYNISEIPEIDLDPESEAAVNREIQQLQEKLKTMGEVNLVAIEEHKKLQERLSFLEQQEKDLIEAKESLITAIRKINKTTRDMFSQTFQNVRQAFKEIFPLLFGGGDADLVLEEGVDCLEAGIEILARPPGKKLQNVNLFSGGEKALTALSLLLAIFKIKPSPFCILDEIDAPLDESNIDRCRKLLEEFSKNSQFLVITHNKRTISTADVIYGITMESTGISKIISVKFQKAEKVTER